MNEPRKLSIEWLNGLVSDRYGGRDGDPETGAWGFWQDLRALGLIREDLIDWDMPASCDEVWLKPKSHPPGAAPVPAPSPQEDSA